MNGGALKIGRFEEFMINRVGNNAHGTTAHSYDNLISVEDMEAQEQGYSPATDTSRDVKDLLPIVYMTTGATGKIVPPCILRTLLDTGSRKSLISSRCLSSEVQIELLKQKEVMKTMVGRVQPQGTVVLTDLRFSEINKNLVMNEQTYYVFKAPCRYDVIAGRDFMQPNEMIPNMKKKVVKWFDTQSQ